MPDISIIVNGRAYRVTCGAGEEARLSGLAQDLDRRVSELGRAIGQASEAQMLLLAALLLADELDEARAVAASRPAPIVPPAPRLPGPDRSLELAAEVDALAQRIEALAARWEAA